MAGRGLSAPPTPRCPALISSLLPSPQGMRPPGLFGRLKAAVVGVVHVGALPGKRRPGGPPALRPPSTAGRRDRAGPGRALVGVTR